MLRRLAAVAAVCATTLPLFGGSASASCVDDLQATPLWGGTYRPFSDHMYRWVHVQGTATVTFEGDDLIWDAGALAHNLGEDARTLTTNAPRATSEFVDCVAG